MDNNEAKINVMMDMLSDDRKQRLFKTISNTGLDIQSRPKEVRRNMYGKVVEFTVEFNDEESVNQYVYLLGTFLILTEKEMAETGLPPVPTNVDIVTFKIIDIEVFKDSNIESFLEHKNRIDKNENFQLHIKNETGKDGDAVVNDKTVADTSTYVYDETSATKALEKILSESYIKLPNEEDKPKPSSALHINANILDVDDVGKFMKIMLIELIDGGDDENPMNLSIYYNYRNFILNWLQNSEFQKDIIRFKNAQEILKWINEGIADCHYKINKQ